MKLCSSYNPYNVRRMKFLHTKHSYLGLAPAFKHRTHVVVETK